MLIRDTSPTTEAPDSKVQRRDRGPDMPDVAIVQQSLDPAMTGRGADIDPLRQIRIAEPPVVLQQVEHLQIYPVSFCHEIFFNYSTVKAMKCWFLAEDI